MSLKSLEPHIENIGMYLDMQQLSNSELLKYASQMTADPVSTLHIRAHAKLLKLHVGTWVGGKK